MSTQNTNPEDEYVLLAPPTSPLGAIRALWRALRQLYDHFFLFAVLGVLLFLSLPTIILPGVVIAAIYRIARQAQTSPAPDTGDLLPALRGAIPWGGVLFLSGLLGSGLLLLNVTFYGNTAKLWLLQPFWLMLLIFWLSMGFYSYAVGVALKRRSLLRIMQVAFLFVAARPLTTLTIWIGVPLLTIIAAVVPLLLFLLPSLFALWATALTYPYPPEPEEPFAEA